jgi:outer membrane protein OmpA-like peptidoglycan-associated protein
MTQRRFTGRTRVVLGAALLLSLGACGSSGPEITPQLVDARRVVNQAQVGRTAKLAPDKMQDAWNAYLKAEKAHDKDPGSYREAHLAYVALRKAEEANAGAKTVLALRTKHALDARYQAKLARQGMEEQSVARAEIEQTGEEQDAQEALDALREVADVKQDANTIVITLSSAVLFPTDGHALSDGAEKSLDKVAAAIEAQPEGSRIRVDGYTDSTGAEAYNEKLSKKRADAVSDYLTKQGVEKDKLTAEGKGESDPIASNDTREGRANNRRAEIVIELPPGALQSTASSRGGASAPPSPSGSDTGTTSPSSKQQPPSSSAKSAGEDKSSDYPDTSSTYPDKTSGKPSDSGSNSSGKLPMVPVPMPQQQRPE